MINHTQMIVILQLINKGSHFLERVI